MLKVHSRVSWKDGALYTASPEREFVKISKPNLRLWTKAFPSHFKYSYLILDCEAGTEMSSNSLLFIKANVGQWMNYWSKNHFTDKTLKVVFVSLRIQIVGAMLTAFNNDGHFCGACTVVPPATGGWISPFRKLRYLQTYSS